MVDAALAGAVGVAVVGAIVSIDSAVVVVIDGAVVGGAVVGGAVVVNIVEAGLRGGWIVVVLSVSGG